MAIPKNAQRHLLRQGICWPTRCVFLIRTPNAAPALSLSNEPTGRICHCGLNGQKCVTFATNPQFGSIVRCGCNH